MTRTHSTADEVARRLLERATGAIHPVFAFAGPYGLADDAAGAATMRLLNDVEMLLSRWIGSEGYRALLLNAARLTLPLHPALSTVLTVDGFRPAAPNDGPTTPDALASGMVALLVTLMELLGRIVGEEMAERLVEQAGAPSPSIEPAPKHAQRHLPRMR
ncbi:hypothetical protein [Gemmatimonas sp.]|uniref:hypothetical protein n=1 Tax=Gemmatimonas sp. TaxID=1962908 RepID=UPI0035659AF0